MSCAGGVQGANPPLVAAPAPQAPPIAVLVPSPPPSPGVAFCAIGLPEGERKSLETLSCTLDSFGIAFSPTATSMLYLILDYPINLHTGVSDAELIIS